MNEPMIDPSAQMPAPMPVEQETPDYLIVEEYSKSALEKIVTQLMSLGWKPTGGVHVRKAPEWSHIYTQAMTKGI